MKWTGGLSHSLCLCSEFPQRSRAVHHQLQTRAGETAASFLPGNNRPVCCGRRRVTRGHVTVTSSAVTCHETVSAAASLPTPTSGPASFDVVAKVTRTALGGHSFDYFTLNFGQHFTLNWGLPHMSVNLFCLQSRCCPGQR